MAGLLNAFEGGIKGLFGEGFADRAARALAIENGDFEGAARISKQMHEQKAARQQTEQLVGALRHQGISDDQIAVMLTNPEKLGEYYNARFQPSTIDEGSSRITPNLNGTQNIFTAPKTFQHGADVMQTAPATALLPQPVGGDPLSHLPLTANPNFEVNGNASRIDGLRTDAEQYADSLGLERGSKQWGGAVKDYALKGYGPSAREMLGDRLDNQAGIAAGHDAASRYRVDHPAPRRGSAPKAPKAPTPQTVIGQIMYKQAQGAQLTPAEENTLKDYRTHYKPQHGAVEISPNEAVAHGPRGKKLVVRNGHWVNAQTGEPVK